MRIFKVSDSPVAMSEGGVTGRRLYDRPEVGIVHMELEPGSAVAPHATPFDAEFFVIDGEGIVTIGDDETIAGPGTLVEGPKGAPHGIRNTGKGVMRLLVLRTPNPAG